MMKYLLKNICCLFFIILFIELKIKFDEYECCRIYCLELNVNVITVKHELVTFRSFKLEGEEAHLSNTCQHFEKLVSFSVCISIPHPQTPTPASLPTPAPGSAEMSRSQLFLAMTVIL